MTPAVSRVSGLAVGPHLLTGLGTSADLGLPLDSEFLSGRAVAQSAPWRGGTLANNWVGR